MAALGPWFHNLHLPDGTQTAPSHPYGDFPSFKWREVAEAVPADLSGWSALDIGCNAGYYSIELAKRGARVTGLDVEPLYLRQARWVTARFGMQDRVRFIEGHVYELLDSAPFDFVWFTGVFYHLKYPALALDIVRRLTRRWMMFQTMTLPGEEVAEVPDDLRLEDRRVMREPGWPKMAFIERRLANDKTNWWAANHACVEALLRAAGFEVVARPAHEFYLCRPVEPPDTTDLDRVREAMLRRSAMDARGTAAPESATRDRG
jgi:tRNA (mo5U34)-methyltransferase